MELELSPSKAVKAQHYVRLKLIGVWSASQVKDKPRKDRKPGKLEFMELELSSFKSVKAFAEAYRARNLPIDVLICTAGAMMERTRQTGDGIEVRIGEEQG